MRLPPRNTPAARGDERLLRALSRRGLAYWGLSTALLLGLGLAVAVLTLTQLHAAADWFPAPETRLRLLLALAALLLVFSVYALFQHQRIAALARTLIDEHVRTTTLESRLSEITSLFDVAARLHLQLELEPVLETITHRLMPCLEADEASIMLLDESTQELRCLAVSGADDQLVRQASVPMGQGIAGHVAASGEATIILEEDVGHRFPGEQKAWRSISSAMCVPLQLGGRIVGVLNVARLGGRPPFNEGHLQLLKPFAEHLAITVRRIGEFQALDRRANALERTHLLRREFLSALNHELRTPLASVIGYAQLLREQAATLSEREREGFVTALSEQAGRMLESVDDLHGLYSLEASEITFETSRGSLNQLVQDSVTALEGRAARRRITVETALDPRLPAVWMDHAKLHSAIRHLLAAALRVSATDGRVTIATRYEEPAEGQGAAALEIHVLTGSGAGVFGADAPDGDDSAESRHTDALGWGVLLIRELVELHGGSLTSERTAEGGVRLALALPARTAERAKAA